MANISTIRLNGTNYTVGNIIVDSELNELSENPVQNKIITQEFNNIFNPNEMKIIVQPVDTKALIGNNVSFVCIAIGNNISYQWQYKTASSSVWNNSRIGNNCYTFVVTEQNINQKVRCVLTQGSEELISDEAMITLYE